MAERQADAGDERREPTVEELLARARPLPPHAEMVISDLTAEEAAAFFAAVNS